jgi:2-polyprenyl-3-methyl-5-hydroxy-6-metoxy-1,4-benzoquinol methylase
MQTLACPICGESGHQFVFRDTGYDKKSYSIVRCDSCAFMYVNPQPSDEALARIYGDYYGSEKDTARTEQALEFRRPVFEEIMSIIGPAPQGGGRLLDIGCGNGDFLVKARERGWTVSGIEFSGPGANFARSRGLDVKEGSFSELPYEDGTFSVVTLLDVLEHLREPLKTLVSVKRVLKPGGVLIVRVPNTPFQLVKARVQRLTKGAAFTTMATPLHLNHFDSKSLASALRMAGLRVKRVDPGSADGEGKKLLLKRAYVGASLLASRLAGLQIGNILCAQAVKQDFSAV